MVDFSKPSRWSHVGGFFREVWPVLVALFIFIVYALIPWQQQQDSKKIRVLYWQSIPIDNDGQPQHAVEIKVGYNECIQIAITPSENITDEHAKLMIDHYEGIVLRTPTEYGESPQALTLQAHRSECLSVDLLDAERIKRLTNGTGQTIEDLKRR